MKRKLLWFCFTLLFATLLASCGSSRYFSIKESDPVKPPSMSQYEEIHLGWMPYEENDWVQYGYEKKEHWLEVTRILNIDGLQKNMRDFMPGKTITADAGPGAGIPETGGLYINFKRFNSPVQDMQSWCLVDVDFVDIRSKKVIYSASAEIYKGRGGYSDYSFEGRLLTLTYWIDNFVLHQLK
ncbi:MAG: hypothetical protein A2075_11035 [Geobacteraceae bacterium GWC2_58_44]|nr:MAG: hypothetical protein A2075_11035 [Geobacteraceae bacterium GWC2_58_44]HBG07987.1 hypothetical protein [Geobacter sp.]